MMIEMNAKKLISILIIVLFFVVPISLSGADSNPLPEHHLIWGSIEYSDGFWVPNEVAVTVNDLDNGNNMVVII